MNGRTYEIIGIDSLLFRDGRPFSNEGSSLIARSLPAPLPGTVAGFLRTQLGERLGWDWKADGPSKAMATPVIGPLLRRNGGVVISKPADALMMPTGEKPGQNETARAIPLRPLLRLSGGCDTPNGFHPCAPPEIEEGKPARGFRLWEWEKIIKWLLDPDTDEFRSMDDIGGLPREERAHTAIDSETGLAKEGMLYTTEFVHFDDHRWSDKERHVEWSLLAKVGNVEADLGGAGLLGGERRIAMLRQVEDKAIPRCPDELDNILKSSKMVRMLLVTPALFRNGWKPGWLDDNLEGTPPFACSLKLRLVSAIIERRTAVSGWDFVSCSPKPVRWLAPEGSAYFFEIVSGNRSELTEKGWLAPVSDEEQDRRDGYGLALWGVY